MEYAEIHSALAFAKAAILANSAFWASDSPQFFPAQLLHELRKSGFEEG